MRRAEVREALCASGHNLDHLSDVKLDLSRLNVSGDLAEVVAQCSHLVLAIPSAFIASVLNSLPPSAYVGKKFVSAIKGAVPEVANSVSYYLEHCLRVPPQDICVISGPTHAEEVCRQMPTFLAVASSNLALAKEVESLLECGYLHTLNTDNIVGVEVAGLMKNIYAIGAGICQGVGYGDNMTAVYVTTAYREMVTAARNLQFGAEYDMAIYCYLGDLMVTCWSQHSRNRRLGYLLGKGMDKDEIFKQLGTTPEGYYSARIVHQFLSELHHLLPLSEAVYRVLYEGSTAQSEMERIISSSL